MTNPRRNSPRPSKPGVGGSSPPGRIPPVGKSPEARFRLFVDLRKSGACWPWLGSRNPEGYGNFKIGAKHIQAHRAAFEFAFGPIAPGAVIRHACSHPWCVNPKHLRAGTHADNRRDTVLAGRQARGSKNGRAKLDERTAREAFRRMADGEKKTYLAEEYGVSRRALRLLESGKNWRTIHASPIQQRLVIGATENARLRGAR